MNYIADAQSLFNFAFDLKRGDRIVAVVQHRLFGRKGVVTVDGVEYEVVRTGPVAWDLVQVGVPGAVVSVERPTMLRTRYRLSWNGMSIDVQRSGLGYRMRLFRGDQEVGSCRLANFFSRRLLFEVPDDMPVTAVALLTWIVVRMRRAAAASAAGGG